MNFQDYSKYLRFGWDEELERVEEWLHARQTNQDWGEGGDKYWIGLPVEEIGCPSFEELKQALAGRDMQADFAIIDSDDDSQKEQLYLDLRDSMM